MKIIFALLLATTQLLCAGQEKKPAKKYILLRIQEDFDKENQRSYSKIIPDGWCEGANEIYGLQLYINRRGAENKVATVYHNRVDSSQKFYNYFWSPTEALNFMSANGWNLVSIISSNSTDGGSFIPTIISRQVFCFYKE
jgi:hypothetical protein